MEPPEVMCWATSELSNLVNDVVRNVEYNTELKNTFITFSTASDVKTIIVAFPVYVAIVIIFAIRDVDQVSG